MLRGFLHLISASTCLAISGCHPHAKPAAHNRLPQCEWSQVSLSLSAVTSSGMMHQQSTYRLKPGAHTTCALATSPTLWIIRPSHPWQRITATSPFSPTLPVNIIIRSTGPAIEPGDPGYNTPFNRIAITPTPKPDLRSISARFPAHYRHNLQYQTR